MKAPKDAAATEVMPSKPKPKQKVIQFVVRGFWHLDDDLSSAASAIVELDLVLDSLRAYGSAEMEWSIAEVDADA